MASLQLSRERVRLNENTMVTRLGITIGIRPRREILGLLLLILFLMNGGFCHLAGCAVVDVASVSILPRDLLNQSKHNKAGLKNMGGTLY